MRIKRVEIIGFKSFCDRAVVNIGESITGVVGPNGCGKSNIVDAIRWCMGEQSAKHLRGKAMEDVIFAGSETRGPAPMAEVSLTFDDVGFSHETLELARTSDEAETERALESIATEDGEGGDAVAVATKDAEGAADSIDAAMAAADAAHVDGDALKAVKEGASGTAEAAEAAAAGAAGAAGAGCAVIVRCRARPRWRPRPWPAGRRACSPGRARSGSGPCSPRACPAAR